MDEQPIQKLVETVKEVVIASHALFGFVFELTEDRLGIRKGCPLIGAIADEAILRSYFRASGERALALVASKSNQSVAVSAPNDSGADQRSWFCAVLTQKIPYNACVLIFYRFYDEAEAVRTLRLIELIIPDRRDRV
jgi:hypothetical protein